MCKVMTSVNATVNLEIVDVLYLKIEMYRSEKQNPNYVFFSQKPFLVILIQYKCELLRLLI